MKKVGLRVDVDTWRGTRDGVPRLLEIFDSNQIKASFFFTVGPDNMGRHLWRLIKPQFLCKMLRSKAALLYGWDILLAGTAWPGRCIGRGQPDIIRTTACHHEVGLHAWDHFAWQTWAGVWPSERLDQEIALAHDALIAITGEAVTCSAVAGWLADQRIVAVKERFRFRYNSDCRGQQPFLPVLSNGETATVQIPVTLPTWDEAIGTLTDYDNYNTFILDQIHQNGATPVYTIHAEVEGIALHEQFSALLTMAKRSNIQFCPLSELLPADLSQLPHGRIVRGKQNGREGWLGCQQINE